MTIDLSSHKDDQYFSDRLYDRKNVVIDAYVRLIQGGKSLVRILDVSETGFRMDTSVKYELDKDIFLSILGFQSLEANIVWHRETLYGCTFLVPLHPAILQHISNIFAHRGNEKQSL